MDYVNLKNKWLLEEQNSFMGWDFSYLNKRWKVEKLPWSYKKWVNTYRKSKDNLLDMGTGGGEFLLTLNHPYQNTTITEAWEPNIQLCKEKLQPLGIRVVPIVNDVLPFQDDSFDIIINRHESYNLNEVRRILKPNGIFITQQVGGKNNERLSKKLIQDFKQQFPTFCLKTQSQQFKTEGFTILYENEHFSKLHFFDVGAVVYYAKIIKWEFPEFSVARCFDTLCKLQNEVEDYGYIESMEHRFIIVAKNR